MWSGPSMPSDPEEEWELLGDNGTSEGWRNEVEVEDTTSSPDMSVDTNGMRQYGADTMGGASSSVRGCRCMRCNVSDYFLIVFAIYLFCRVAENTLFLRSQPIF